MRATARRQAASSAARSLDASWGSKRSPVERSPAGWVGSRHNPQPKPANSAAPRAVASTSEGPYDREPGEIGLTLHQVAVRARTAIDQQLVDRRAGLVAQDLDQLGDLVGDTVQGGTHDVGARRPTCHSKQGGARIGVPMWRTEAGKGRNQVYATAIVDAARQLFRLRCVFQEAELIAQPLHDDAGSEDAALDGVARIATQVDSEGR